MKALSAQGVPQTLWVVDPPRVFCQARIAEEEMHMLIAMALNVSIHALMCMRVAVEIAHASDKAGTCSGSM